MNLYNCVFAVVGGDDGPAFTAPNSPDGHAELVERLLSSRLRRVVPQAAAALAAAGLPVDVVNPK